MEFGLWCSSPAAMKPAHAALLIAASALAPRAALAQESAPPSVAVEDEESLLREGVELRRQGRDEAAVAVLRRAYALRASARASGQLGLAEQSIGRWARAEALLRSALAAVDDPWVTLRRATLEGALAVAEQHLATVEVVGGSPGAELWVDGERAGALPGDRVLRVAAGTVRVEHRAPGGVVTARVLDVVPRAIERVYFAADAAPERPVPAAVAPVVVAPAVVIPTSARRVHALTWAGAATAGASAIALTAVWAVGEGVAGDYDAACTAAARPDRAQCAVRLVDDQRRLDTLGAVTDAGWVLLGAGLAATAVGLVLSATSTHGHPPRVTLAPMPAGAVLVATF